jgi:hypothetical protein
VKFTERTIDGRTPKDRTLFRLEQDTGLPIRAAYYPLRGLCDRAGRFEWRPAELQTEILPHDPCDMLDVLNALASALYVVKYVVAGRGYGWWPAMAHVTGINAKESASVLPPPPPNVVAWYETAILARNMGQTFDIPNPLSDTAQATVPPPYKNTTLEPPPGGDSIGVSLTTLENNTLRDRSRVGHASTTGEAHDSHAVGSRSDAACSVLSVALVERESQIRAGLETLGSETAGPGHAVTLADATSPSGGRVQALPAIRGKRDVPAIIARLVTTLDEVTAGRRDPIGREQWHKLAAELVFAYWAKLFGKEQSYLARDDPRERRILARLRENDGNVGELCYALDGGKRSRYHQGDNPTGTVYDTIDTLLRDRGQVEKLAGMVPAYRQGAPHRMVVKYAAVLLEDGAPEAIRRSLGLAPGDDPHEPNDRNGSNGSAHVPTNGNGAHVIHDGDDSPTSTGHHEP